LSHWWEVHLEDLNIMAIITIIIIITMNIDPTVAGLAELLGAGSVELLGAGSAVLLEDFLVDFLLVVAASQDRKVVSKSL
jgi:hypothetical protein